MCELLMLADVLHNVPVFLALSFVNNLCLNAFVCACGCVCMVYACLLVICGKHCFNDCCKRTSICYDDDDDDDDNIGGNDNHIHVCDYGVCVCVCVCV